jgi:Arc/MetJ-type ribon-helix-helix transcriptional regulator
MPEIEFSGKRKSKTAAFSLTPNTLAKLDSYASSGDYGNKSSIVQQAITEFFAREEMREEDKQLGDSIQETITSYLTSPEGKALIKSILSESLAQPKEPTKNNPVVVHTSEYVTDDIIGKEIK